MWAQYREELDGGKVIEVEGGFLAYRTQPAWDNIVISDVYIRPDFRRSGLAKRLTEQVEKVAREMGKPFLVGYADVTSNTCAVSLASQIAVGFVPFCADNDRIWLRKKVGG